MVSIPGSPVAMGFPVPISGLSKASQTQVPSSATTIDVSQPKSTAAYVGPQIRFGHDLTRNDYLVSHGVSVPITMDTSAKTLMQLMQQAYYKIAQGDSSNLKYSLQAHGNDTIHSVAALGDNLLMVGRPIDSVIQSYAGSSTLFPILMARFSNADSRTYMNAEARINLAPKDILTHGENHRFQIDRERINEFVRDQEALIQAISGETDRSKVYQDLNSVRDLTSLQALGYGKKGLVDAILVDQSKVLSRQKLNEFYISQGWDIEANQKEIQKFAKNPENVKEIPSEFLTELKGFNAASATSELMVAPLQRHRYQEISLPKQFLIFKRGLNSPHFSVENAKAFLTDRIKSTPEYTSQLQYWRPFPFPGLIYDDSVLFHAEFTEFSGNQVNDALQALDEKKQIQKASGKTPSNIKIWVNSPGGYVLALDEIRSQLSQTRTPVDVIVGGMAASCGSGLLASATGNRLALPNARIMLHQLSSGEHTRNYQHMNEERDDLQAINDQLAGIIAKSAGRDKKDVLKDLKQDTWLNPFEAMFYGSKGLLDGIMIGPCKVVTKADVLDYLKTDESTQAFFKEKYGKDTPDENVEAYLADRLERLHEPTQTHKPDEWEAEYGKDPFSNPLNTLIKISGNAKNIAEVPELKASATQVQDTVDHFVVGIDDPRTAFLAPFFDDKIQQKARELSHH